MITIDAEGLHYRELNQRIREGIGNGESAWTLQGIRGQRYIGTALQAPARIAIHGTAGEDTAAFMNGAEITVYGNAQTGVANTMNSGRVAVHGCTGDILGYAMRGGCVLVRDGAGYRAGIHMKSYKDRKPAIVIGGTAGDYLGEYMAGGVLVVLGLDCGSRSPAGNYVGTGMHGGAIYVRGGLENHQLGAEVGRREITEDDWEELLRLCRLYGAEFDVDVSHFKKEEFIKLSPVTSRPYGRLYAY